MADKMIELVRVITMQQVDGATGEVLQSAERTEKIKVLTSSLYAQGFIRKEDAVKYVEIDKKKTCDQRSVMLEANGVNLNNTTGELIEYSRGVNDMLGWVNTNNPIKLKVNQNDRT